MQTTLPSDTVSYAHAERLISTGMISAPALSLLRWLVWFPLLSPCQLAALCGEESQGLLAHLAALHLLQTIQIQAVGGKASERGRCYVTDLGLFVLCAASVPPLSLTRLVAAYPVDREDLSARLMRPPLLSPLASLFTRLVVEGEREDLRLTSFQRPWKQTMTVFGRRVTLEADAILLLAPEPGGAEYGALLRMDTDERRLFDAKRCLVWLSQLTRVRQALQLDRESLPPLLIVTTEPRMAAWTSVLDECRRTLDTALLEGLLTTTERQARGVYAPIWWPFPDLVRSLEQGQATTLPHAGVALSAVCAGRVASGRLVEQISGRRSFLHLLTQGPIHTHRTGSRVYVGENLSSEAARLSAATIEAAMAGTPMEQREVAALLTLRLSEAQEAMLHWLAHHPLLSREAMLSLVYPEHQDARAFLKACDGLQALGLLLPFFWSRGGTFQERERFLLTQAALRFQELHDGVPSTTYVLPPGLRKKQGALRVQWGAAGLFAQMEHTSALYSCLVRLWRRTEKSLMLRILTWKSAHEASRGSLLNGHSFPIRPDAELLLFAPLSVAPQSVLIEYDRGTTFARELQAKFEAYADYQRVTKTLLPPILVVMQQPQVHARIRESIRAVGATALDVILVSETELLARGLAAVLTSSDDQH